MYKQKQIIKKIKTINKLYYRTVVIGLHSEGYSTTNKKKYWIKTCDDDIWWWINPSVWMNIESYCIIILFLFRVKTYDANAPKIYYSDDAAEAHDAVIQWIKAFFKLINGIHLQIAKCGTMYLQVADSYNCNRVFKHKTRKIGRKKKENMYEMLF